MSLREIKNELYQKEPDKEVFRHEKSEYNSDSIIFNSSKKAELPKDDWLENEETISGGDRKNIKTGAWILGGLLLVIFLVVGFYKIKQSFFSSNNVVITLTGPLEVKSGNLVAYEIKYKNANTADLKNVVLKLSYPEDFKPEGNAQFKNEGTMASTAKLADIKGGGEGAIIFNGRTYSPKGNLIKIKAELAYMPSTASATFMVSDQLAIGVASVPLSLEVLAPQSISTGDQVNYLITYRNNGTEILENIRLKIDYPERFTFASADPRAFEGNNIWYLGSLPGGQIGKIIVVGKLEGNRDEMKIAKIAIGTNDSNGQFIKNNEETIRTKIASSPLAITQTVNGLKNSNINAGDNLQFELSYKNEGTVGLRDVIITEQLESLILDYETLSVVGGAYDTSNKTITWKASDYPELKNLAPGQSGKISFSVKVKGMIPVASANDKNFVISSLAKIDSPDIPTPISTNKIISSNKMDLKLNSKLLLNINGFYNDTNIANSGPIPPKVGQETTYTIHFAIANVSNDIENAKVETILPTSVVMTGKIFPEGSPLQYNERTNSITWNVGKVIAGMGIISARNEISFQVKIKPSPDQAGDEAPLLNATTFSAKDLFTGENISAIVSGKSTRLLEDSALGNNFKVTN